MVEWKLRMYEDIQNLLDEAQPKQREEERAKCIAARRWMI